MMRQLFVFAAVSLFLAGCTSTLNRTGSTAPESKPTAAQSVCQPSRLLKTENPFPEIQGTMKSDGELWALLFFDKAYPHQDLKFVWRITFTGTGPSFHAEAKNENGLALLPVWGPDFHDSSTWNRPGTEWGTGFNFPEPGCWTITVTSGATQGEITLEVLHP
jgi:hypothetical protein